MSAAGWYAVVVAAGRGTRFGGPKQLVEIAGKPMLAWSIETLASIAQIERLVVTTEPENAAALQPVVETSAGRVPFRVVPGGEERQDSVRLALETLVRDGACDANLVLVHDGARPMVSASDIRRGMNAVRPGIGATLAIRVVDTIKEVDGERIVRTHDRTRLWAAQTPQFATLGELVRAHQDAQRGGFRATDDAALLERLGIDVLVVEGSSENFKVTVPADLERAELILRERAAV